MIPDDDDDDDDDDMNAYCCICSLRGIKDLKDRDTHTTFNTSAVNTMHSQLLSTDITLLLLGSKHEYSTYI